jgi:hypothetical protein
VLSPTHVAIQQPVISPDRSGNQVGGSGVYFSNGNVTLGTSTANISVQTYLDNFSSSSVPLTVFSNAGAPTLTLNGGTPVTLTPLVMDGMTIPDTYSTSSA